jgi:hypothetical protein
MEKLEGKKFSGMFSVSGEREIYGEVTFGGTNTSLYLQDEKSFTVIGNPDKCIHGVLNDLKKVSLINCIGPSEPGVVQGKNGGYHFVDIFPHYVVIGDQHFNPSDETISSISFVVDDANTLFYDFDIFGHLSDSKKFIETLVAAHSLKIEREIEIGPNPEVFYYTGKQEIFSTHTKIGTISAKHNINSTWPSASGIALKNTIVVTISFDEPEDFDDAITHTLTVTRYLGLLVGRPQNLIAVYLQARLSGEPLQVYWSSPPRREGSEEGGRIHPAAVLLNPIQEPARFSQALKEWINRQSQWEGARGRFFYSFEQQNRHGYDRIIGAANMFDVLPATAVPSDQPISDSVKAAKDQCEKSFKSLPDSPERNSILTALGGIGKSNLTQKILHRAKPIIELTGACFPQVDVVIAEAVKCRNYYVHGSDKPRFNYNENFLVVAFLTNTLEFVFSASDLIEAGWDIAAWSKRSSILAHPFSLYRFHYHDNLRDLLKLLPARLD